MQRLLNNTAHHTKQENTKIWTAMEQLGSGIEDVRRCSMVFKKLAKEDYQEGLPELIANGLQALHSVLIYRYMDLLRVMQRSIGGHGHG